MKRIHAILWLPVIVVIFLAGCADQPPIHDKDGRLYGTTRGVFSFKWWDYYERGASLADGGYYEEALGAFSEATGQREGDQRHVRTYGLHFIEYFPYRERGIVYYQQQRYLEAAAELEKSLQSAESSKAKYFLNLTRKALNEKSGKDSAPPKVIIEHPAADAIVNAFATRVSGVAADDTFISEVRVNDSVLPFELSSPRFSFAETLPLLEGINTITVVATDIAGKTATSAVRIMADRQGPAISLKRCENQNGKAELSFSVTDHTGIAKIALNTREVPVPPQSKMLELTEPFTESALHITAITATDVAGNITTATVAASELARLSSRYTRVASLDWDRFAMASPGADTESPVITIHDLEKSQETYRDSVLIELEVTDASPIQSLTLNGEEVQSGGGRKIFFSALKKLNVGENTFHVRAMDARGNSSSHTFTLTKKVQKVRQVGSRLSIALLPMERKGESTWITDTLQRRLVSAFVNQKRFRIVERQDLDKILQEQHLTAAMLNDPKEAIRVGRIVAADTMLTGAIVETPGSLEIITYLVDTESAVILAANDVYGEDKSHAAYNRLLDVLAFKYESDFPLLEGEILEQRDESVTVNLGATKKIKEHMKLICFREGPELVSPVSGKSLGSDVMELGTLKVVNVFADWAKAEVIRQDQPLQVRDKVIAK